MLECVANVSEGRNLFVLDELAKAAGSSLLDLHSDTFHHRSVFTLAGERVVDDAIALANAAVELLDLREHEGAHPRLGVIDVVPFVPLGDAGLVHPLQLGEALTARSQFVDHVSEQLNLPCFIYGPERSLPFIRKSAFQTLLPDRGPSVPHRTAGAVCVGARGILIAYNVNVTGLSFAQAKKIAAAIRSAHLRTLAFCLGTDLQISCNLIDPLSIGIETSYDQIVALVREAGGEVREAELVGLLPKSLLDHIPQNRWSELVVDPESTIESRLKRDGDH